MTELTTRTTQEERERWRRACQVCDEIALVPDNWPARCRRLLADLDAVEADAERLRKDNARMRACQLSWTSQEVRDLRAEVERLREELLKPAIDGSCRNHGSCPWCRAIAQRKKRLADLKRKAVRRERSQQVHQP